MAALRLFAVLALGLVPLAAMAAAPAPVRAHTVTKDYRLDLAIGQMEPMYSTQEVEAKHLTKGEIMVGGKMTMATGPGWHHLELHVLARKTRAPVTDAHVRITVIDLGTNMKASVPVVAMYGIKEGKADWHYGNNVRMAPGRYRVEVSANGERAHFIVVMPAS